MEDQFGSISTKDFEGIFGYEFESRSHNVVEDCSFTAADVLMPSCWTNLPPEILRDVLMRIEKSECVWPCRKNVVACAGVCRSWREIMKEIVKRLEVSGTLTFPITLKQPGPRTTSIQCFIKRVRSTETYLLYLNSSQVNDEEKFLLAARRFKQPTYTDYIISLNADEVSNGSNNYIGKLRSNFFGTQFTIYDAQPPNAGVKVIKSHSTQLVGTRQVSPRVPAGNYPVAHLSYELNVLGSRGPRRMQCVMDAIPVSSIEHEGMAPSQTQFFPGNLDSFPSLPFYRSKSDNFQSGSTRKDKTLVLKNKTPRWHEQLQCWCLNFNGRVTVASVKNFQLVAFLENNEEQENVILQFGKVGKDVFTMDYQYPISAFQAFAICLSSFDSKIACE